MRKILWTRIRPAQVVDCDEVAKSKTQREKRRVPKTDRTKTSKLATSPSPSADTCPTTPPPQETVRILGN